MANLQIGPECVYRNTSGKSLQNKHNKKYKNAKKYKIQKYGRVCVQEHLGQNCVREGRAQLDKIQKYEKSKNMAKCVSYMKTGGKSVSVCRGRSIVPAHKWPEQM